MQDSRLSLFKTFSWSWRASFRWILERTLWRILYRILCKDSVNDSLEYKLKDSFKDYVEGFFEGFLAGFFERIVYLKGFYTKLPTLGVKRPLCFSNLKEQECQNHVFCGCRFSALCMEVMFFDFWGKKWWIWNCICGLGALNQSCPVTLCVFLCTPPPWSLLEPCTVGDLCQGNTSGRSTSEVCLTPLYPATCCKCQLSFHKFFVDLLPRNMTNNWPKLTIKHTTDLDQTFQKPPPRKKRQLHVNQPKEWAILAHGG